MITINEDTELVEIQRELKNNGYKEIAKEYYEKFYYVGKRWRNIKLKNGEVLESISIRHVIVISEEDFIQWAIYFGGEKKGRGLVWVEDVLDILLEQFNKSAKVLYDNIKKSRVSISKDSYSLPRKHGQFLKFNVYSIDLPISKGIEDLRKLFKVLPSIVKRIDSIMVRKQKGRF